MGFFSLAFLVVLMKESNFIAKFALTRKIDRGKRIVTCLPRSANDVSKHSRNTDTRKSFFTLIVYFCTIHWVH